MKRLFNILAALVIFVLLLVAVVFLYSLAFAPGDDGSVTDAQQATEVTVSEIGIPFISAWVSRDVPSLKNLLRGEFEGALPELVPWERGELPPFKTKQRISTEVEHREQTDDFDIFFGRLLDQLAGVDVVSTEFSIIRSMNFSENRKSFWSIRLLLAATGFNEDGGISQYRSENELVSSIPPKSSDVPPSIRLWQIETELERVSQAPVKEQLQNLLAEKGVEIDDRSFYSMDLEDVDQDQDLDIAVTTKDGRRFLFLFKDGAYENATTAMGLVDQEVRDSQVTRPITAFFDYNADGFMDLLSNRQVFENQGGKKFVDVTEQSGVIEILGDPSINTLGELRRRFRIDQ
ncbi:MAG: VCBS repeat-containing protein [Mariniblastus sp.]|nr:VCBS repeat-containing protein [Mariniblastus sp.]MDG2183908.1 VCBS repeat-containing protein [Mariniblastus sp.]